MEVAHLFSYKGGQGRTMALVNLGALVARLGKRVLLVDLDLAAPALHLYLPPDTAKVPARDLGGFVTWCVAEFANQGINLTEQDEVGGEQPGRAQISDYIAEMPTGSGSLSVLYAGEPDDDPYYDKARIVESILSQALAFPVLDRAEDGAGENEPAASDDFGSGPDGETSAAAGWAAELTRVESDTWKALLRELGDLDFDCVLFDLPAGLGAFTISAINGLGGTLAAFVASEQLATGVRETVDKRFVVGKDFHYILSKVKSYPSEQLRFIWSRYPVFSDRITRSLTKAIAQEISTALSETLDYEPVVNVIRTDPELELRPIARIPTTGDVLDTALASDYIHFAASLFTGWKTTAADIRQALEDSGTTFVPHAEGFYLTPDTPGHLINAMDGERNVAFRVETANAILRAAVRDLSDLDALTDIGYRVGAGFIAKSFEDVEHVPGTGDADGRHKLLEWAAFDTAAGFGYIQVEMADDDNVVVTILEPFFAGSDASKSTEESLAAGHAWLAGYVRGVLDTRLGDEWKVDRDEYASDSLMVKLSRGAAAQ